MFAKNTPVNTKEILLYLRVHKKKQNCLRTFGDLLTTFVGGLIKPF